MFTNPLADPLVVCSQMAIKERHLESRFIGTDTQELNNGNNPLKWMV